MLEKLLEDLAKYTLLGFCFTAGALSALWVLLLLGRALGVFDH